MEDCVFCKIVRKENPAEIVTETPELLVFKDIKPSTEIHFLIIPKKHITDIVEDNGEIWKAAGDIAKKLAAERKLTGFRLVHNAGSASVVKHMHVHLLGDVSDERGL